VTTEAFQSGWSSNVIAERKGTLSPASIVVVGAHYDSRSTDVNSPTQRAPGADDNASGVSNLVELARLISANDVRMENTVRLIAFGGEEQGLVGSRNYAAKQKQAGAKIIAMFNGDMLGYTLPARAIRIGMKDKYIDASLLLKANDLTRLYVPNLPIGVSASCCSDHQSFTENGFPAIGYFEHEGGASDYPAYHKSDDLPANLNPTQLGLEARAIMAATLTYIGAHSKVV